MPGSAVLRFASLRCGLQRLCAERCKKHLRTNQNCNKAAGACRIVQICDVEAQACKPGILVDCEQC